MRFVLSHLEPEPRWAPGKTEISSAQANTCSVFLFVVHTVGMIGFVCYEDKR